MHPSKLYMFINECYTCTAVGVCVYRCVGVFGIYIHMYLYKLNYKLFSHFVHKNYKTKISINL